MHQRNRSTLRVCLPIGCCLALGVVACGGDASSNTSNTGGSSNASGGSSTSAGNTSKAGSTSSAGTTSGSGSGFDTGLPDDKPLSSLSDDETAALCKKYEEFYSSGAVADSLKDYTCSLAAIFAAAFSNAQTDADVQAVCKMTYDPCLAEPVETTSTCTKPGATCTATVAEVEACTNDSAKALEGLKDLFPSCDTLTLAQLMDAGGADTSAMNPASCTALEAKCPGGPKSPLSQ